MAPFSLPFFNTNANERTSTVHRVNFHDVLKSYGIDWVAVVALWFFLKWFSTVPGFQREFSLDKDITIQHTFAVHERVPSRLLLIISLIIPLSSLVLISIAFVRNSWDTHNAVLSLFWSYTTAGLVTQFIKICVGRPRPDLINRCLPLAGAHDAYPYGLSNATICTQTNMGLLHDGFKSFPSGHSSLSFAGLGIVCFYLCGKLKLFGIRGHGVRAWVPMMPLLLASWVAVSRTADNRHHWSDILVGSLLGFIVSYISYRGYFPPLHHVHSELPYAPRESTDEVDGSYERLETGNGDESAAHSDRVALRPSSDE